MLLMTGDVTCLELKLCRFTAFAKFEVPDVVAREDKQLQKYYCEALQTFTTVTVHQELLEVSNQHTLSGSCCALHSTHAVPINLLLTYPGLPQHACCIKCDPPQPEELALPVTYYSFLPDIKVWQRLPHLGGAPLLRTEGCSSPVPNAASRCVCRTLHQLQKARLHAVTPIPTFAGAYTTARTVQQNNVFELTAHVNRLASSCHQMLENEYKVRTLRHWHASYLYLSPNAQQSQTSRRQHGHACRIE